MSIKEVYEVVVDDVPKTFGERIRASFAQGIKNVQTFGANFLIWFAASWFWIVLLAVVVIVVICIFVHYHKIKKNK